MLRRLLLPALATLGIVIAGCEEYDDPKIPNTGPSLSVTGVTEGDNLTDSLKLDLVAYDDKYTNSLGIYLINLDEENSLEYSYAVPATSINKTESKVKHRISLVQKRVVNGNYRLLLTSQDVQGLTDQEEFAITVSANATNVDTIRTDKVQVWDVSVKKAVSPFFSIQNMKAFAQNTLKNPNNLAKIDIVVAKIGGVVSFYSQSATKSIDSGSGFTAKDSLGTFDVKFFETTLSATEFAATKTSTKIREIYNTLYAQNLNVAHSSIAVKQNTVYAVKTEKGLYALLKVGSITGNSIILTGAYKRFF